MQKQGLFLKLVLETEAVFKGAITLEILSCESFRKSCEILRNIAKYCEILRSISKYFSWKYLAKVLRKSCASLAKYCERFRMSCERLAQVLRKSCESLRNIAKYCEIFPNISGLFFIFRPIATPSEVGDPPNLDPNQTSNDALELAV